MDRSDSKGIVPRRWSDGQDSMQVAGYMKHGMKHGPALRPRFSFAGDGGMKDGASRMPIAAHLCP
ncbi:MAG: hypothetical protein NTW51_01555 [Cyanobacteria bacterium]|nr:hypothetical protein [Cyanobacteriota bacterium]